MRMAWILQDMTGQGMKETEFATEEEACAAARRLRGVHPRSVSRPSWDIIAFGPGDGTMSALVRYLPVAEDEQGKK